MCPIEIGTPEVAVPILIPVVESKVIFPLASKSNVVESISIGLIRFYPISIPPVPSIEILPPPASISILPADLCYITTLWYYNCKVPLSIVKFELPTPSNEIVDVESIVNLHLYLKLMKYQSEHQLYFHHLLNLIAPLASTSNVLASISIGLSLSVPIEIDVSESNVNAPAAFTSNTPLPLIVIAPLASISKVDESTSIGTSASTPISIPVEPSNVNFPPSASTSTLAEPFIVTELPSILTGTLSSKPI